MLRRPGLDGVDDLGDRSVGRDEHVDPGLA
jgi:hypothetical protein